MICIKNFTPNRIGTIGGKRAKNAVKMKNAATQLRRIEARLSFAFKIIQV